MVENKGYITTALLTLTLASTPALADCKSFDQLNDAVANAGVNIYGDEYSSHDVDANATKGNRYRVEFIHSGKSTIQWVTINKTGNKYQCTN